MTRKSDGIVVGYDGSPGAERALRWAVREAWERGTVLTVCLAWAPEYLAMLGEASVYDLARRWGEEILAKGAGYAGDALGPETVRPVLARGPATTISAVPLRSHSTCAAGPRASTGRTVSGPSASPA